MTNYLIIFKDILSNLEYYVFYCLYIKNEDEKKVAESLNTTVKVINLIKEKIILKTNPYKNVNSYAYQLKIRALTKRKKNFNTLPINPDDIIKYLYLKQDLSYLEKEIYLACAFQNVKYTKEQMAWLLNTNENLVLENLDNIKRKRREINENEYRIFYQQYINKYGIKIYDFDLKEKIDTIDYHFLVSQFANYSYTEFIELIKNSNVQIAKTVQPALKKYFLTDEYKMSKKYLERQLNISLFNYKHKKTNLSKEVLYNEYLKLKDTFTLEQQLYLETYVFKKQNKKLFTTMYPNSKVEHNRLSMINRLEKSYFHILDYFDLSLTKEEYLMVKEQFIDYFKEEEIKILDLYFGVNCNKYPPLMIASLLGIDEQAMTSKLRNCKDKTISILYGISRCNIIDKEKYIPYVLDKKYNINDKTRAILKLFLIDNLSYEQISKSYSLNKNQVSQIIMDGIKVIDFYRFKIEENFLDEDGLEKFVKDNKHFLTKEELEMVKLNFLNFKNSSEIASILNTSNRRVISCLTKFKNKYLNYQIKKVILDINFLLEELNKHPCESVLDEEEKKFVSYYYAIRCPYNLEGKRLNKDEMCALFSWNLKKYAFMYDKAMQKLKLKKIGFIKAKDLYIPRNEIINIMNDVHLPINDREKCIIKHFYGIDEYELLNIKEMSLKWHEKSDYIRRAYKTGILKIYKYLNKEIPGIIDYESDIVPNLKYFGLSDRKKLTLLYKEKYTANKLAKQYNITLGQAYIIIYRLRNNINNILTNKDAKKFDFDFYLQAIKDPKLPYYKDLDLAVKCFNLAFGMELDERLSAKEIVDKLNLKIQAKTVNQIIMELMLSVCKLQNKIVKENTFTYNDVINYFNMHEQTVNKVVYENYFTKVKNNRSIKPIVIPEIILGDLMKENCPYYLNIDSLSKSEVIKILQTNKTKISKTLRKALMSYFKICERELMSGKELKHVYKIFNELNEELTIKKDANLLLTKQ